MHFSKIVTIHHRKRLHSVPLMSLAPHRSVRLPRRVVIAGRFVITSCRKLKLRLKGSLQRHTSIPDLIEIRRAVGLNCAERDGHGRRSVALVWRASRKHGVTIRRDGLLMQNGDAAAVTVNLRASESRQFFVTVCSTYRLRKTDVWVPYVLLSLCLQQSSSRSKLLSVLQTQQLLWNFDATQGRAHSSPWNTWHATPAALTSYTLLLSIIRFYTFRNRHR